MKKPFKVGMTVDRKMVKKAIEAQADDETLWCIWVSISEAYMQQSLRWLHRVIEDGDEMAMASIIAQSKGE